MKKILLLFIIFFPAITICQNEYKLTTESVIWQGFSKNEAVVTAFITLTKAGNVEDWYDNFSGFILRSKNSSEIYKMVDARKILGNDLMLGNVVSVSISFLVPKNADSLMLKYPERFEGKEIFLVRSYNLSKKEKESDSYVSEEDVTFSTNIKPDSDAKSKPGSSSSKTNLIPNVVPTYANLTGGIGLFKTNLGNKQEVFWQLIYSIKPVLFNVKKKNLVFILDFDFGFTSVQFGSSNKATNYLSFYGLNKDSLSAQNDSSSTIPINIFSIYGGLGMVYNKNKVISPFISTKIGWNWINNSYVRIYNKTTGLNSIISRAEDLSGLGFKLEVGAYIVNNLCLSYNFYSIKTNSGNSILNAYYTGHFLNLSIGGPNF